MPNLWQTKLWQNFQQQQGRKTWFFQNKESSALVIKSKLPFGYNWLDIPRGPIGKQKILKKIITTLQKQEPKTIFIRIMPEKKLNISSLKELSKFKIRKAHISHQPETTLKIDLTQSEEKILAQMKPKGRYNIRLAIKKGVKIFRSQNTQQFYDLIQTTTTRDNFSGHSQQFYQNMLNFFKNNAELLFAEYKGKIIAGGIFIYTKNEAIYYYGASSNQYRNVMAPYLIQWNAILEGKKRNCKFYDFLGIAPENSSPLHPWKGVTDFKKKFGGIIISYQPAQEIILKPFLYSFLIFLKSLKSFTKKFST